MFSVYDNGKLALGSNIGLAEHFGWNVAKYETFEEAKIYAMRWLGIHYEDLVAEWTGPNSVDYSGSGDIISIVEE